MRAMPSTSPFFAVPDADERERLRAHADAAGGHGAPGRFVLGADVDHPGLAALVEMGEFFVHNQALRMRRTNAVAACPKVSTISSAPLRPPGPLPEMIRRLVALAVCAALLPVQAQVLPDLGRRRPTPPCRTSRSAPSATA